MRLRNGGLLYAEGGTLTFTAVNEDSVYSVSGKLKGNIVIDIGDDYKFDIEASGLSLVSDTASPICHTERKRGVRHREIGNRKFHIR